MKNNLSPRAGALAWLRTSVLALLACLWSALPLLAGTPIYQINCGGEAVGSFAADTYFNGGAAYAKETEVDVSGVQNPPPVEVYSTIRALWQGSFSYTFPALTPGVPYLVRLHFADIFSTDPGTRIFNVALNGTAMLTDFDVIATVGGPNIAVAREFTVPASGAGEIVVEFSYVIDSAIPAAIEVLTSDSQAPLVVVANPKDNTVLNAPANITIDATASSTSGTIAKVEFYEGTTLLGADTTSPYSFNWSKVSPGGYTITAVATDNRGLNTTSPPVRVKVVGPGSPVYQVNCGGPAAGGFAPDNFFIGGDAYTKDIEVDASGVQNPPPLEVYKSVRATGASSFGYVFPGLTPGANYTIRLHFADIFSSEAGQRVFSTDINRSRVLSDFDIIAAAGGQNLAIVREFPAAADADGKISVLFSNVADSAIPAAIEVLVGPSDLPPALLTKPANLSVARAGTAVVVEAVTTDAGGAVAKVEFFAGTSKIGETQQAPYHLVWENPPAGTHVLTAKVTSSSGKSAVAAGVLVTVHESGRAYQINCGGEAVGPFAGDAYYVGGQAYSKDASVDASAISNPPPLNIYNTVRALWQGSFSYVFPGLVPAASYTVRLHFADVFSTDPGARVFNVAVNDQPMLADFDIIAVAGGPNIAVVQDLAVKADDSGQINIGFSYVVDSALPAAIEILGEVATTAPPSLVVERSGDGFSLRWEALGYVLQECAGIGQAWTSIPGAQSPYSPPVTSGTRFFRLMKQ